MITDVYIQNNNNTNFLARLSPEARRNMSQILTPLVDSYTPMKDMVKQTEYSTENINRWSLKKFGMTIAQLYRKRENEKLKDEFVEHRKNRTLLKEMTNIYTHSGQWIKHRYIEMGLDSIMVERHKILDENIPWMLDAGYTLKKMKEKLNVSKDTIITWIFKNKGCGIREYRKTNNISLNREP